MWMYFYLWNAVTWICDIKIAETMIDSEPNTGNCSDRWIASLVQSVQEVSNRIRATIQ